LPKEATKPAARNFLQQQARFDKFIEVFSIPQTCIGAFIPPSKRTPVRPAADGVLVTPALLSDASRQS
jgi:hypothetical protein